MNPVTLELLITWFTQNIYRIKQSDIQRPVPGPIYHSTTLLAMVSKRIPYEDGIVEYIIKDETTPLVHCPQSSVPFFVYLYVINNETLLYNGCHYVQDYSFDDYARAHVLVNETS